MTTHRIILKSGETIISSGDSVPARGQLGIKSVTRIRPGLSAKQMITAADLIVRSIRLGTFSLKK